MYDRQYRLPTEAEWERAARGGKEGALYVWGDEPPHERPEYNRRWTGVVNGPRPVGQETPNAFGIFDIGENVHEWCADWFDKNYYAVSTERNPGGRRPGSGEHRAAGPGDTISRSAAARRGPAFRRRFQYADYGFRIVCECTEVVRQHV